ncbi:MAG: gfo/Idh/MocA family oxidoreductase, partial [Armatimonadota bacterium]
MPNELCTSAEEALAYVETVPPRQGESMVGVPFEARDLVRVGFVGVGGRGYGQLNEVLAVEGVQVTAISDASEAATARAGQAVEAKGQPAPALEADWRRLCDRDDV